MKALALAPALALAAFVLIAPPLAEAGHRHSNGCGHRQYSSRGHGYRAPSYGHGHRHYRPAPYYRGGYGPGYYPAPSYGYGGYYGAYGYGDYGYGYYPPPPPPRYYRHRPRVGIYFGF